MSEAAVTKCPELDKAKPLRDHIYDQSTCPVISISCVTFNQDKFIIEAIESFLDQITNVPVEIIVYDDASTDSTVEILKEYQSRFPYHFVLNLQDENQFSKGIDVDACNLMVARGKFIAFCHGDDFWCDPRKLQMQFDILSSHDVDMCGHPSKCIDIDSRETGEVTGFKVRQVTHISSHKIISSGGNMIPMSSMMVNSQGKCRMIEHIPPVAFHTGMQILGSFKNGLVILPNLMSTYRVNVPGSTTEILIKDQKKVLNTAKVRMTSYNHLKNMYGSSYRTDFIKLFAAHSSLVVTTSKSDAKSIIKKILEHEKIGHRFIFYSCFFIFRIKIEVKKFFARFKSQ